MSNPPWAVEQIPDPDSLYLRAHKSFFDEGELQPRVFTPHGGSISVDWSKYATPAQTQAGGRKPKQNSVVTLIAGQIRAIPPMTVIHDPNTLPNPSQAHSGICGLPEDGELKTEIRARLLDAVADTPIMFSE